MIQSHFWAFSIGGNQSGRIFLLGEWWGVEVGGNFLSLLPPFVLQLALSFSVVSGLPAPKPLSPHWSWAVQGGLKSLLSAHWKVKRERGSPGMASGWSSCKINVFLLQILVTSVVYFSALQYQEILFLASTSPKTPFYYSSWYKTGIVHSLTLRNDGKEEKSHQTSPLIRRGFVLLSVGKLQVKG